MSPRAAWRLETLGFEHVYDYVAGKVDWLAHDLATEGDEAGRPTAGALARDDVPSVALDEDLTDDLRARLDDGAHGFALVLGATEVVLGRVRRSALDANHATSVEAVMEPGPSTVRPHLAARELLERLERSQLTTAVVTTPEGRLVGVAHRRDLERAVRGGA